MRGALVGHTDGVSVGPQGPGWWQASDGRWYPPQARPGYPPPSPYGYSTSTPPPKGRSGCTTALLIVGALAAIATLLIVVLVMVGVFAAAKKADQAITAKSGRPASYAGPSYPGMITADHVADARGQVEDYGFTVTAANFRRAGGDLGQYVVCADITYLNRTATVGNFDFIADWKLQEPDGVVSYSDLVADSPPGRLLPGTSISGMTCFQDNGQHGQYVLIWRPIINLRADRGIWLFALP